MTDGAVNVETFSAAFEGFLIDGNGADIHVIGSRRRGAGFLPGRRWHGSPTLRVGRPRAARRALDQRARGATVVKEISRLQRPIGGLPSHLLLTGGCQQGQNTGRSRREIPWRLLVIAGTSDTSRGLSPAKNWCVAARSKRGSAASMHRKKRSRVARAKRGTLKQRMIRHRQAAQRQHAEHRRSATRQDRQLERHRDERRPTVERPAADVERIADDRAVILHDVRRTRSPAMPPSSTSSGSFVRAEAQRLGQLLDRETASRHPCACSRSRRADCAAATSAVGVLELGEQAVESGSCPSVRLLGSLRRIVVLHARPPAAASASRRSRSSAGSG